MSTIILEVTLFGVPVEVECDYRPGRPGRYCGPPEDCYEDEPEEIDIAAIRIGGIDVTPLLDNFDSYRLDEAIRRRINDEG